jgi:SNF2 family DNA or RNA helicase
MCGAKASSILIHWEKLLNIVWNQEMTTAAMSAVRIEEKKTDDAWTNNTASSGLCRYGRKTERSPKVQALLDEIKKNGQRRKAVIFSHWTSFLDVIQKEMQMEGHTMTSVDGSMTAAQRERFRTQDCDSKKTPRFIFCSAVFGLVEQASILFAATSSFSRTRTGT